MPQVTEKQHFVPEFYLKLFADGGFIQVLDVKNRRLAKARPYGSVCYQKFFYAEETGLEDEVSQAIEEFFGVLETRVAAEFPQVIEHAHTKALTINDLETLAYMLSLQWLRTNVFRQRMKTMESNVLGQLSKIYAKTPSFPQELQEAAGKTMTPEEIEVVRQSFIRSEHTISFKGNRTHLGFLTPERVEGFHRLFMVKQWNVIHAGGQCHFITSDNPVSDVINSAGFYGAHFLQRQHYLSLTPDLMIASLEPKIEGAPEYAPLKTLRYGTCNDDDVMALNTIIANHAGEYAYARGRAEFNELLSRANS